MSYIIWDIDPQVFSFSSIPRWYGIMWAVGVFLSYEVMQYVYRNESKTEKELSALAIYIITGTIIGARLGHVLFYDPVYYLNKPWEVLPIKLDNGFEFTGLSGLASHGGTVGILLALTLYCFKYKINYLWIADRLAIAGALCGGFIRIGNLLNSEIYGVTTSVPWAFIFTRIDQYPRHPTQIYEALVYFFLFGLLLYFYRKGYFKNSNGLMFGLLLTLLFSFRFFVEFLKVDQEMIDYNTWFNAGQLLSVPLVLVGLFMVVFRIYRLKTNL
ncbi:MAG: prolipoprotein diacylglyceryl transferase [Bacteroidota bacterium]